MRQYANMRQYDPTNEADLKALQDRTNDTVRLTAGRNLPAVLSL